MKIVHVIFSMKTGGSEQMLVDIANCQAMAGHNVSILIINNQANSEIIDRLLEQVNVVRINRPEGSRNPLWLWRYNQKLRALKPQLVHFHNIMAPSITFLPKKVATIGTLHIPGLDVRRFKNLGAICSISQAVADDAFQRNKISTRVVTNGVDFNAIATKNSMPPGNAALENGTSGSPFEIVQVGRMKNDIKGQDLTLRAIALLIEKGLNIHLTFMGGGDDLDANQALARSLGIEGHVTFKGNTPRQEIYSTLCNYDLFVMPSRIEGFGLTLVEAMAAKIPVLASDAGGPAEIIAQNRYGTLFRSGDFAHMAQQIQTIVSAYPIILANAQSKAYKHASENYSVQATARNYLDIYQTLIAQTNN